MEDSSTMTMTPSDVGFPVVQWKSEIDGRLGRQAASCLADHLSYSCPVTDGESEPESGKLDVLMKDIAQELSLRHKALDHPHGVFENDFLQGVKEEGVRLWKSNASSLPPLKTSTTKQGSKPFSLLLGGGLASFVNWDIIEEKSQGDLKRKVEMLENVEHLQDILLDWEDYIAPFFLEGLRIETKTKNGTTSFLDLHRSWFGKSRSSTEFRYLQISLCENLVTVVEEFWPMRGETVIDQHNSQRRRNLVALVLQMFEDWMNRGLYVHDPRVLLIGKKIWAWLAGIVKDRQLVLSDVALAVVSIDPSASWFTAWTAHLSPDQCLAVVCQDTSILSKSLDWCHAYVESNPNGTASNSEDRALLAFWTSVYYGVLETTRVARFPWDSVLVNRQVDAKAKISVILDLCAWWIVRNQASNQEKDADFVLSMCLDAVDLLWIGNFSHDVNMVFMKKTIQTMLDGLEKVTEGSRKRFIYQSLKRTIGTE